MLNILTTKSFLFFFTTATFVLCSSHSELKLFDLRHSSINSIDLLKSSSSTAMAPPRKRKAGAEAADSTADASTADNELNEIEQQLCAHAASAYNDFVQFFQRRTSVRLCVHVKRVRSKLICILTQHTHTCMHLRSRFTSRACAHTQHAYRNSLQRTA